MDNEKLLNQAKEAIQTLHDDTSVSKEKAIENLSYLIDEMEMMIEGLKY